MGKKKTKMSFTLQLFMGILATWAITEWYSHEQFVGIRNWAVKQKNNGKENKLLNLLSCVFCTSHWIALFVSILITYFHHNLILTFLYTFIFVRCANFLNDISYPYHRSPGHRNINNLFQP